MDIYFCDLCGVRVTDADLRAGHGIRSHWDVICSTCLEMGHGKDWLSQRTKPKASAASPTLDAARDRLATLEEEAPAPVAGKAVRAIAPEPPNQAGEPTPSDAHPVLNETDLTSTARVPTPGRGDQMQLAAAANMFSALGQAPQTANKTRGNTPQPPADAIDDLNDDDQAPPLPEDPIPARAAAIVSDTVSPFDFNKSPEKDETVAGLEDIPESDDRLALEAAPAPAAKDKPSTGTSSRHKKAGASSRIAKSPAKAGATSKAPSKSPKSSTKLTARSRKSSGKDSGRMILIGSIISLAVIGILFVVVMQVRQPTKRKVMVGTDLSEITAIIKDTEKKVNDSLRIDDLAAMESALATLNNASAKIADFEQTALKNGDGEDKVEGVLRSLKWPDVYAQSRNLRDRIGIKKRQ